MITTIHMMVYETCSTQMEEIDGEANCIVSGVSIRATVPAMDECFQDTQACKQNLRGLILFCY